MGLDLFIGQVARLGATYDSLAGVVVLLLWLLVTAYAVLLGAEINAEVQRAAERAGSPAHAATAAAGTSRIPTTAPTGAARGSRT